MVKRGSIAQRQQRIAGLNKAREAKRRLKHPLSAETEQSDADMPLEQDIVHTRSGRQSFGGSYDERGPQRATTEALRAIRAKNIRIAAAAKKKKKPSLSERMSYISKKRFDRNPTEQDAAEEQVDDNEGRADNIADVVNEDPELTALKETNKKLLEQQKNLVKEIHCLKTRVKRAEEREIRTKKNMERKLKRLQDKTRQAADAESESSNSKYDGSDDYQLVGFSGVVDE
uniref:Uncharacterized protein n=1 Tax=Panagrolaimus davidi TaxID=227884 RepID=A0A914QY21_9BILA